MTEKLNPRIAVYPGSFDPVTNGHLDVVRRGAKMYDKVIVATAINQGKPGFFSMEERLAFLKQAAAEFDNVEVDTFDGLMVDYVQSRGARVVLRGLRSSLDFEYEFKMALANRVFGPEVESVFIMASQEHLFMSSGFVKQVAAAGADISSFVPECVEKAIKARL